MKHVCSQWSGRLAVYLIYWEVYTNEWFFLTSFSTKTAQQPNKKQHVFRGWGDVHVIFVVPFTRVGGWVFFYEFMISKQHD